MLKISQMLTLLICIPSLWAQGIRMTSDFLPLEGNNLWKYSVMGPDGTIVDDLTVEIRNYTIVEGKSLYVFNQFPFVPGIEPSVPIGIRYDQKLRVYKWFDGTLEDDLFPETGTSVEVLERDSSGLPLSIVFDFNPGRLILERGVGIIQAELGSQLIELIGARVGGVGIGEILRDLDDSSDMESSDYRDNVSSITNDNPILSVDAFLEGEGHRFVLTVRNAEKKLLPFDFSSSQSFDFIVVDPQHGQEIWRWSRRMFFSKVIRSESIRGLGEWTFQAVWNHRDDNLDKVEPGVYEVVAILTAEIPLESEALRIEIH